MDSKSSHFPANNATSDLKEQSDRGIDMFFCMHLLIHSHTKKKEEKKS